MKYNLSEIMKRAWTIKRENKNNIFSLCLKMAWGEAKSKPEMTLKDKLEAKINFLIENAPDIYYYNPYISNWENYGKSRTYFAIYERARNSTHNCKYDYGYLDNKTEKYIPGRLDLTRNYSIGGKHHLDCDITF